MSAIAKNQVFTAVHTVGGLLPADMLVRIAEGKDVPGSKPADYGVVLGSVTDEAERHWSYFKGLWRELRKQLPTDSEGKPATDHTGIALNRWVLPLFKELGFGLLPEVGGGGLVADDDPEKVFPLSHRWHHVPIHVPTWATDLDKRPGGSGTTPPQSLVQEALNRTSAHLWAVVTNGRQLRLLRDSSALATAAYVEFDLEAIFDGELFNEFVLLYRLLHASRFQVGDGEPPATCRLEKWRGEAITSGTRALEQLRKGVQEAITILGTGFLKHPANAELRQDLDTKALHGALLRMVYRMLFLFVAEDRDALHPPTTQEQAKERYAAYFSSERLRAHARRRRGTAHGDQYEVLRLVLDALGGVGQGNENGRPELGIPAMGGLFSQTDADAPLRGLKLSNEALLGAVRQLAQVRDTQSKRWRPVDYRHMGAEELGSIYESLLELVPKHSAAERTFELVELAGNDRKTTGSYYTPSSLIETLLDSALDPVIDDAIKRGEVAASAGGQPDESESVVAELLKLTVCDPACGSGHFLVAAARRIAKKVAAVREGNPEPTVDAVRSAMHEVVARCIYGVDLNPMAVELAKVSLWLEALEPGKPLSFLDAHVKHGNALIGVTPSLLKDGIPDEAFKPIEGDDKKYARFLAKTNKEERGGQVGLFDIDDESVKVTNAALAQDVRRITGVVGEDLNQVRQQEAAYRELVGSEEYVKARRLADAWCAAFVWKKTEEAPRAVTQEVFRNLSNAKGNGAPYSTIQEIERLSEQYRFFHWHLEFPEVFTVPENGGGVDEATGWAGGFTCVLGNPPWDKVEFEDKKYFSTIDSPIAKISGSGRKDRILEWVKENEKEGEVYLESRRKVKGSFHFLSRSGIFPLSAEGLSAKGVNSLFVEHLFSERFSALTDRLGRFGAVVPTTIATGAGAQYLFKHFVRCGSLSALYGFENRKPLFPEVHSSYPFCVISLVGSGLKESRTRLAFFLQDVSDMGEAGRVFELSPEEISLINPNTGNLPVFRSRRDADLTASIYRRIPVLWDESKSDGNAWGLTFRNLFNTTDSSFLFRVRDSLVEEGWSLEGSVFIRDGQRMLPVYEGKMVHHFDHRWSSFHGTGNDDTSGLSLVEKKDPSSSSFPRYWIPENDVPSDGRSQRGGGALGVLSRLKKVGWEREWMLGWRDITNATNERTAISAFIPKSAVVETFPLMITDFSPELLSALCAVQSSFIYDYVSRQKVSDSHMKVFIWKQLPVPIPDDLTSHLTFLVRRFGELVYTTYEMEPLARDLNILGAPFQWNEERRSAVKAEIDALFFHLYGINRDDMEYIMETFPIVRRKDVEKYGTYRTKERILEIYDRMAEVGVSQETPLVDGENFVSELTPPPGHGPRHAPA